MVNILSFKFAELEAFQEETKRIVSEEEAKRKQIVLEAQESERGIDRLNILYMEAREETKRHLQARWPFTMHALNGDYKAAAFALVEHYPARARCPSLHISTSTCHFVIIGTYTQLYL